ncbi:MAG: hypothetical protein NDI62_02585 [Burkholderiales bacterium]|nr:hypothetical protein [Burkholderiales bacterium]
METFLTNAVPTSKGKIFLNTVFWGFILWLFGYILGFVFFAIAPKELIGWYILPFGVAFTLFVLIKRVSRSEFGCYFGLGLIWTIMAIVLDYFLLIKMLNATNYYKIDVYIYYILTFILPLLVGWYKFKKNN